jgi:hypothetical protein
VSIQEKRAGGIIVRYRIGDGPKTIQVESGSSSPRQVPWTSC